MSSPAPSELQKPEATSIRSGRTVGARPDGGRKRAAAGWGVSVEHGRRRPMPLAFILTVLACGLAGSVLFSVAEGPVHLSLGTLIGAIAGHRPLSATERIILFHIRLPRVLASVVVGSGLSCAGLLFQGLFRNPMADPYIIGSAGGAVAGACLGILFFSQVTLFGFSGTALLAFVGSVLTMLLVYALARSANGTDLVALLLAGFAVSTMLANGPYLFEVLDPDPAAGTRVLAAWLRGAIGTPQWRPLGLAAVLLGVALCAAIPLTRRLDTLALGDEYAQQLGVPIERTRMALILTGSLLTAVAVSLGGLIGFAGLIVPHAARMLLGPGHVRLLPVTALAGAIFLVLADTLARTAFAPRELPVGVLMALLGGPFFLYLLRKARREQVL